MLAFHVHGQAVRGRFGWYQTGLRTLLDIARGLAYLHSRKPWVSEAVHHVWMCR